MTEAIMKRVSTRSFHKDGLTSNEINQIRDILKKYSEMEGPFGNKFEFTFTLNTKDKEKGKKIGTYGMFKNIPAFIGGVSFDGRNALIDYGYVFEKIILELTDLGFDTCWIGGTFKRSKFKKGLEPNEVVPAVCAVGHRAEKQSWIEKKVRSSIIADKRLPFKELFQYFDVEEALEEREGSRFVDIMKLVRKGPSASNKQPWRLFVNDKHDKVYVYLKRNEGYGASLGYDIQALDAGIACAHLELGLEHNNFTFLKEAEKEDVFFDGLEYIITYKRATTEE